MLLREHRFIMHLFFVTHTTVLCRELVSISPHQPFGKFNCYGQSMRRGNAEGDNIEPVYFIFSVYRYVYNIHNIRHVLFNLTVVACPVPPWPCGVLRDVAVCLNMSRVRGSISTCLLVISLVSSLLLRS